MSKSQPPKPKVRATLTKSLVNTKTGKVTKGPTKEMSMTPISSKEFFQNGPVKKKAPSRSEYVGRGPSSIYRR